MLSLYKERLYIGTYGYAQSVLKLLTECKDTVWMDRILQNPMFNKNKAVRYK